MGTRRTAIYRLFDAQDQLLYVGRSTAPDSRIRVHRRCIAGWQLLIARSEIEWFASSTSAARAQRRITAVEKPLHLDPGADLSAPKIVPVFVYRLFDAEDRLLYVGQSNDPDRRVHQHPDAWKMVRWTLEEFPDRLSATQAEGAAIVNENPLYNTTRGRHGHIEEVRPRYVNPWPYAEKLRAQYDAGEITIRAAFEGMLLVPKIGPRKACHMLGFSDGGWACKKTHTTIDQLIALNGL